ncbi:MAG: phosphosulfolactate synthase [Deltaproteobacteria bacterium]|nr:phosphosulfolactate synthase [Deltaproteobacteria bacterium]
MKDRQRDVAFQEIVIPDWPSKPRERGITMVADWGFGLSRQEDLIQTTGEYVDLVKIVVAISRILPREVLARQLQRYKENQIQPFPGGQFLEIAILQKRVKEYCQAALDVGYEAIEVSDNAIPLTFEEKSAVIKQALDSGLRVIGEAGKKVATTDMSELIADIKNTLKAPLKAGAWKVFVEAKEIFGEGLNEKLIKQLADSVDISKLLFEIPLVSVQEVHHYQGYKMWMWLLETFGPEVNIANVEYDDPMKLATLRLGIGPDTTLKQGAFCRSLNGEFAKK